MFKYSFSTLLVVIQTRCTAARLYSSLYRHAAKLEAFSQKEEVQIRFLHILFHL
jgi:hypothetical protein